MRKFLCLCTRKEFFYFCASGIYLFFSAVLFCSYKTQSLAASEMALAASKLAYCAGVFAVIALFLYIVVRKALRRRMSSDLVSKPVKWDIPVIYVEKWLFPAEPEVNPYISERRRYYPQVCTIEGQTLKIRKFNIYGIPFYENNKKPHFLTAEKSCEYMLARGMMPAFLRPNGDLIAYKVLFADDEVCWYWRKVPFMRNMADIFVLKKSAYGSEEHFRWICGISDLPLLTWSGLMITLDITWLYIAVRLILRECFALAVFVPFITAFVYFAVKELCILCKCFFARVMYVWFGMGKQRNDHK